MDIGTLIKGEQKEILFPFTNTGQSDLIIEIATACRCANIEWPIEAIPPNGRGVIKVLFDSTDQKKGYMVKAVDIVSNTDPMLVEVLFSVYIE